MRIVIPNVLFVSESCLHNARRVTKTIIYSVQRVEMLQIVRQHISLMPLGNVDPVPHHVKIARVLELHA